MTLSPHKGCWATETHADLEFDTQSRSRSSSILSEADPDSSATKLDEHQPFNQVAITSWCRYASHSRTLCPKLAKT